MVRTHSGLAERARVPVTIRIDEELLVYCLRGLAFGCAEPGRRRIAVRGTTQDSWRENDNCITFRFTDNVWKERFLSEARRLFPKGQWEEVA